MTTIELVRHAKAAARERWWGRPDHERPLTDAGWAQARGLAAELVAAGPVDALYSSPYLRCVQTLEPLAADVGLPVFDAEGLAEARTLPVSDGGNAWVSAAWLAGRGLGFLDEVARTHRGGRVVACSHGDLIPALLAAVIGRDGLDHTDVRCRKGARYTLTLEGARCVALAYVEAPAD